MTLDAWITLGVVVAAVALLVTERLSPPFVMLGAVAALLLIGVVDQKDAFAGFSNEAPLTVAALYVFAGAVERTGALEYLSSRILGTNPDSRSDRSLIARLTVPIAAASAFMNNTTIVAMTAPPVAAWARRVGRPASKLLMPISHAAVLGGLITLIGTSTNLVVRGLMDQAGLAPMRFFEIGKAGLPVAAAGALMLVVVAPRLLPVRRAPGETLQETREYTVELLVETSSPLAGTTVADAGLRNLQGVYLVEIERNGYRVAPVQPNDRIEAGDRLIFAGNVQRILDLQRMPGLVLAEERHFSTANTTGRLYEVVVSSSSPLVNSTLKRVGFRARYGGAVLAVHRAGERVGAKLGEVPLRAGDVLLVLSDAAFRQRWADHRDFLVVAPMQGTAPLRRERAWVVGVIGAALVVSVAAGLLDVLPAAILAALLLVATRVLTISEARDSIDLDVLITIAASFGLGAAVRRSGLAEVIGGGFVSAFDGFGDMGLLAGVLLATMVITELISNNAAAVLMFPIAIAAAQQAGLDPRPFAFAIAIGASASFLSPIGYQTNLMVYGMGGYRFADFPRVGIFVNAIVIPVALVSIAAAWPLRP